MTRDEKLAVIAGNIRDAAVGESRTEGFLEGNLYELALIAEESDSISSALDIAMLVLPESDPKRLALFCRIYHKYFGDHGRTFPYPEYAEKSSAVAMPEIARLDHALSVLRLNGMQLEREHGDSFASCAEDVEYGNSRYVLMPHCDPAEGRLRAFDKLRERYGLKIHCVVNISDGEDGEYVYQLCGLGFPDDAMMPVRLSFSAETKHDPILFLGGAEVFDCLVTEAEFKTTNNISSIKAVLDIERMETSALGGLIMYLNAAADITIDGCYAEIHHKSKGL